LLDKNAEVGDYDDPALSSLSGQGLMTLPPFRDAGGVCEDYLRELRIFVVEKLQQKLGRAILEMTPMECWITLPAIWSEEAKVATLQAAKNAGFANRLGDEIFTIAEPEAAAVATLKKYAGRDQLDGVKPFEHILICDCGGGTVDITTYTITQIYPRLSFDELCIGVGGKCGATYIDRNLHTLLSKRFRNAFDNVPHEQKGPGSKFMTSFEKLKRSFGYDQDRGIREVGPLKLNVPDSMFYDEDERVVKLS
jgi:molecular chaperone DnaK (HSP70)